MKKNPLAEPVRSLLGATHLVKIDHTDLTETTADTAQTIAIAVVGAHTLVEVVGTYVPTTIEDTTDAAFNDVALTIGDSGSANRLLAAQQINENGTEVTGKAGEGPHVYTGATNTVNATFGSMSAKSLSDIDKGEVWIFLKEVPLPTQGRTLG